MRFSDWQSRLARYVEEAKAKPFSWGAQDCAMFACGCIEVVTGKDTAAPFRGKYDDEAGAANSLKHFLNAEEGSATDLEKVVEILAAAHGFEEVPPLMAQRGDLVLCKQGGLPAMGIIDFNGRAIMIAAPQGIVFHPIAMAYRAWRVD